MGLKSQGKLTLAQQYEGLKSSPYCHGSGSNRRGVLIWRYEAKPSPLSRIYRLKLVFRLGDNPKVIVEEPDLAILANGKALPHVYDQKPPRLCLYLPGAGEWTPQMHLVKTIVPWSFLWLWFFEEWLHTGKWKGGGIHPYKKENQ